MKVLMHRMRVRYQKLGGHYHCRVFTAKVPTEHFIYNYAKNGDLVFDEQEWDDIKLLMAGAEFIEEDNAVTKDNYNDRS